jgi:hypothetical protein
VFFLSKLYKRLNYNIIVIDKPIIKVIKIKERLDPFYSIRGLLVINYFNFLGLILILFILIINLRYFVYFTLNIYF